jgi:hypothetical protein
MKAIESQLELAVPYVHGGETIGEMHARLNAAPIH